NASSTLISLDTILGFLKPKGVIVLVVYYGHDGGRSEKDALLKHVIQLDQKKYNVLKYGFINQKNNPPFIIAVQRKSQLAFPYQSPLNVLLIGHNTISYTNKISYLLNLILVNNPLSSPPHF